MKRISNSSKVHNKEFPETARKALSVAGLRATTQQAILLEIIRREGRHLNAYELYRQAREKQPRLSLATVYRALQKFKKLDLVEEVHFDEAHHHYEVKPSSEHHHLVCLSCGRVIEFQYPLVRQIKKNVSDARGFEIVETEVRMSGYCSRCRRKRK